MRTAHAILLVEDNPADVEITRRALRESAAPVELIVVRDGQEAVDYLLRQGSHAATASWRHPDLMPPSPWPSYDDALAFWYGRINYEQRTPQPGDLKLDRMRALMRRLGDPQDRLRIVHVAGSKGKGSPAAMLAAILTRAGYST